ALEQRNVPLDLRVSYKTRHTATLCLQISGRPIVFGLQILEFYCDPPMTPAEYNEERDVIYPWHRPFVDRIEECIQRYRARRRLSSDREYLFSRYLLLGGIDASVRQFQSTRTIGDDILDDATKNSIREMTA